MHNCGLGDLKDNEVQLVKASRIKSRAKEIHQRLGELTLEAIGLYGEYQKEDGCILTWNGFVNSGAYDLFASYCNENEYAAKQCYEIVSEAIKQSREKYKDVAESMAVGEFAKIYIGANK